MDIDDLRTWIGRETRSVARLDPQQANLMQATLNRKPQFKDGDLLPYLWHWLYFHEAVQANRLGPEGHPQLGDFMPPIDFGDGGGGAPRRMWAGGRLTFESPLRLGSPAEKRSTISDIVFKEGRSGRMIFVTVDHAVEQGGSKCLHEEQTLVYREPADLPAPSTRQAPTDETFSQRWPSNSIMLFRYSALTFNGHRIHYDADYARQEEGYPGLVVHGPLLATLLIDLFARQYPSWPISAFEYRGRSPIFSPNPFEACGKPEGQGWIRDHTGRVAMSALVKWN